MTTNVEIVTDLICMCGECPQWDQVNRKLYWIDVLSGEIHCFSVIDKSLKTFNTEQKIGSIALASSGKIITGLKTGLFSIDFENNQMTPITNPESTNSENRFNDGKCDPAGRFWVGSMSDKGVPNSGSLYTLERDASIVKKLGELSIPNGMAWNLNNGKYYHIDTPTRKVIEYDYNNETGEIKNGVQVIEIDPNEGVPDGMTIDAEGMLWIAHWNGSRVSRWDPNTSKKMDEIFLPVSNVTSCIFGGKNMDELYVTTARVKLNEKELAVQPLAGATFALKQKGIKGVPPTLVDDYDYYNSSS